MALKPDVPPSRYDLQDDHRQGLESHKAPQKNGAVKSDDFLLVGAFFTHTVKNRTLQEQTRQKGCSFNLSDLCLDKITNIMLINISFNV